ncbi:Protein of unknown function [Selenomonas ruminantium]|uniref:DUF1659 domain-containing protein n=1 Tax=Selenomonas ruminantium TaxID=971 RepID=A0A1M6SWY8_SELRU|nr:DUF1659 domain-containing protein [Selenomonas ruminantium]SHK49235.1 Protein of unknown function [Selenomonas ruminantium]
MATRMNPATKLQIKVITATDNSGKEQIAVRSFNVNPALTDADLLAIGTKLGSLQSFPVSDICRQDNAALAE